MFDECPASLYNINVKYSVLMKRVGTTEKLSAKKKKCEFMKVHWSWCFNILWEEFFVLFFPLVTSPFWEGKKTYLNLCGHTKTRANKTLNHPACLRMCAMQKMLFTALTGSGCVAGRLKSSLPRVTERVSVKPLFLQPTTVGQQVVLL